jgi:hypothetical protein
MMSPGLLLFLAIIAAFLLFGISMYLDRKRMLKWEEVAARNGFSFLASGPPPSHPFDLVSRGHSRRNRNIVSWDAGGYRLTLSDYSYTTGSGRSRQTHRQTICVLEDEKVSIPPFSLRREHGIFDALGSSLGMQDIDIPGDQPFSRAFVVKGNETGVLGCFDSDVRSFLLGARGTFSTVEGRNGAMLVNFGRRIDPERYGEYAGFGMELFTRFRAVCARTW